jgi:hypothetical protein
VQSNRSLEPPDRTASRDPSVPVPGDSPGTGSRARGPVARLLSAVRGDRYMADAYEPAWSALLQRRAGPAQKEG